MPDADVEIGPGRAPVQVILTAAAIIANANKFVSEFFERGGLGVTLLITDPTTSEADLKRLEGWWKKVTRGIKKAWETVALRKNVDVRQFGYPLNQLELGGMRGEARAEIAGALGIPLDLLTTDSANYATAREHRQSLYEETIKPRCDFIAATLNEQFFHPLGLELVFHPEQLNVFQKAENEEVESLARLVELGIISPNEARERLGFKGQAPPPTAPTEESLPPSEGAALGSFSPPAFTPEGATALQEPEV
jgi:HK97 family phage portal protein